MSDDELNRFSPGLRKRWLTRLWYRLNRSAEMRKLRRDAVVLAIAERGNFLSASERERMRASIEERSQLLRVCPPGPPRYEFYALPVLPEAHIR